MKKGSAVSKLALATPLVLALGCVGEAVDQNDILALEDIQSTQQALGSTKTRVDISTWAGLTGMVSDGNYRLTADINAAGKTWTPKDFTGTFDGKGHTISNLTINASGDAGLFGSLNQAIVKDVRLTNLNVTGTWFVGGLAAIASDSQVERIAIEGTITATSGFSVGGIFGHMIGGKILRSYAKGTAQSAWFYAGGLVGFAAESTSSLATIEESYAQVTVSADTTNPTRTVYAGGILGRGVGVDIHDVYAVGNVTGRNGVGGLVGYLSCNTSTVWRVYKGIYRGDVFDKSAPAGGWAGVFGIYENCSNRMTNLFWDRSLDTSTNWLSTPDIFRGTTAQLQSPTTPISGIYCMPDVVPGRCGDFNFESSKWDAGTSSQHHALLTVPGPNIQPR